MSATRPSILLWLDEAPEVDEILTRYLGSDALRVARVAVADRPTAEQLAQAEIVFAWSLPPGVIAEMPKLRWIQSATSGVENWLSRPDLRPDIVLTNARGIHGEQMPENILSAMFHVTKDYERARAAQGRQTWDRFIFDLLSGKTLGIVGLGTIGADLAGKARVLGMRVVGIKRTPEPVLNVDEVLGFDGLETVLGQSDFVVLLLPLTAQTDGLMNTKRLSKMKTTAWLLNFARGAHVVDGDLVAAVSAGRIAGAVLDAFREEPLPAGHPFWTTDRIVVLPHLGGRHPDKTRLMSELLAHNVEKFLSGKPMEGLIDRSAGY